MSLSQTKTSPMRTDSARKTCFSRSRSWWRRETFWWMTWSSRDWGQSRRAARASVRPPETETSTATFWSPASVRDRQTKERVSVPLVAVLSSVKTLQSNYRPIIHPSTWPSLTFWEMSEWITDQNDRNQDDFFRCEVGLLPSARTSRLWSARVSNSEWRTRANPTGMKSSSFIHEINQLLSLTWQVAITRMACGERSTAKIRQTSKSLRLRVLWCENNVRRE